MYWSLNGLTRNCPLSAGYARVRVATAKTSPAQPSAKRGAGGAAETCLGRSIVDGPGGSSAQTVARQEEKAGHDFQDREPESGQRGEQHGVANAREAQLRHERDDHGLADADSARGENGEITE